VKRRISKPGDDKAAGARLENYTPRTLKFLTPS